MNLLILFLIPSSISGSIVTVSDGGVYSDITVKIGEEVPRQYCDKVIASVEVRHETSRIKRPESRQF
jgi:hypothetical protein